MARETKGNVVKLVEQDKDLLQQMVRETVQQILEAEMTDTLGAGKGQRTAGRRGYRSGYYERSLVTRVGKLELRVPQDREGRFSTELFERYSRVERALEKHTKEIARLARLIESLGLGQREIFHTMALLATPSPRLGRSKTAKSCFMTPRACARRRGWRARPWRKCRWPPRSKPSASPIAWS